MKRLLALIMSLIMIFMTISIINAQENTEEEDYEDLPLYLEFLEKRGHPVSRGIHSFNRLEREHKVAVLTYLASLRDEEFDYALKIRADFEKKNEKDLFHFLYRKGRAMNDSFPPPFIRFVSDGAHPTFQNSFYVFVDAPYGYKINVYRLMYDFQYMKPVLFEVRRGYHRITGLEAGQRYILRACLTKNGDTGSNYKEIEVTTYPGRPGSLRYRTEGKEGWSDFRLTLDWEKVDGAHHYEISINGVDKVWKTERHTITISDPYISVFKDFPVTVEALPESDIYLNDQSRQNARSVIYVD